MTPLSNEMFWLTITTVFTSVLWAPHILQRILEMNPYAALRDPRHDVATQALWAQRSIRAHANAVENLIIFAVLVLVLEMTGAANELTASAAKLYFIARVAHFAVYSFGVPWLRTPLFLIGFGCQMAIAWAVLGG